MGGTLRYFVTLLILLLTNFHKINKISFSNIFAKPKPLEMPETYTVEVPAGISPGNSFQARIGDELVVLCCPTGAKSGTKLNVKVLRSK